jgi:hypothetical protein
LGDWLQLKYRDRDGALITVTTLICGWVIGCS